MRVPKGEKTFQCSKSFSQSIILRVYLRVHTEERPFSCSQCKKLVSSLSILQKHMRMHQVEKPSNCCQCSKRFLEQTYLRLHLIVHTGEEPYSCCKSFFQKGDMIKHMKTHTVENLKNNLADHFNE